MINPRGYLASCTGPLPWRRFLRSLEVIFRVASQGGGGHCGRCALVLPLRAERQVAAGIPAVLAGEGRRRDQRLRAVDGSPHRQGTPLPSPLSTTSRARVYAMLFT